MDNVCFRGPRAGINCEQELCMDLLCSNVVPVRTLSRLTVCARVAPSVRLAVNDGFFGHSNVTGNLVLEMVRETHDHGPINSWVNPYHARTISLFVAFDILFC